MVPFVNKRYKKVPFFFQKVYIERVRGGSLGRILCIKFLLSNPLGSV